MVKGEKYTLETLKALPEWYDKEPTMADLSKYTLDRQPDYQEEAYGLLRSLKKDWGSGVSTLIAIYNASGRTLHHVSTESEMGREGPEPCDKLFHNGYWQLYLHVKKSAGAFGSEGSIKWYVENDWNKAFKIIWHTPWRGTNTVKAMMDHHVDNIDNTNGYKCNASVGQDASAFAVFTIYYQE